MLLPQLRRIRWAVRATLLLGVAASVLANILHAPHNPISQAIAAWPPVALLLTIELISRVPVHRRLLATGRLVATATIAGIAAWVSYWHMAGVAARYGETGASPYLLPLSVDGLILVASICLVELGGRIAALQQPRAAASHIMVDTAPAERSPVPPPAVPPPAVPPPAGEPVAPPRVLVPAAAQPTSPSATSPRTAMPAAPATSPSSAVPAGPAMSPQTTVPAATTTSPQTTVPAAATTSPHTAQPATPATPNRTAAPTAPAAPRSGAEDTGASPLRRSTAAVLAEVAAALPRSTPAKPVTPAEPGFVPVVTRSGAGIAPRLGAPNGRPAPAQRRAAGTGRGGASGHTGVTHSGKPVPAARSRRSPAETVALAARIKAERPTLTEAELAAELGISPSRWRTVRREAAQATDRSLAA